MHSVRLRKSDVTSATDIQKEIDGISPAGGRVILPEMDLEIDRGIELRSNTTLQGQGKKTVLRKSPGSIYPLSGYHNYGMLDVPLIDAKGLEPGMTVTIGDDEHRGFYETFGRITWVDDNWIGIDTGLHADYQKRFNPVLVTAFPLIYGLDIENAKVSDLVIDGNREEQPAGIGPCRGAAVYFLRSHQIEVQKVEERAFEGEGFGFQMCSRVRVSDCLLEKNAGNGYHPGAGSTGMLFEKCKARDNDLNGLFFCVRANHITVRDCEFTGNLSSGISIGTRDCYNLIENCSIGSNGGPGIIFRKTERPVEMHACLVRRCQIEGNSFKSGDSQIQICGPAHDIAIQENSISGMAGGDETGILVESEARQIWISDNEFDYCSPNISCERESRAREPPKYSYGAEAARRKNFRHLRGITAEKADSSEIFFGNDCQEGA